MIRLTTNQVIGVGVGKKWFYHWSQVLAFKGQFHQSIGTKVLAPKYWHQSIGTKVLAPKYWHQSIDTKAFGKITKKYKQTMLLIAKSCNL